MKPGVRNRLNIPTLQSNKKVSISSTILPVYNYFKEMFRYQKSKRFRQFYDISHQQCIKRVILDKKKRIRPHQINLLFYIFFHKTWSEWASWVSEFFFLELFIEVLTLLIISLWNLISSKIVEFQMHLLENWQKKESKFSGPQKWRV